MHDPTQARERWAVGTEARALVLVTAVLCAFGLATLYSASAFVAMQADHDSTYYFLKQLAGVGVGVVGFALAAKFDAERLERLAWPLMVVTIILMLVTVLPFTHKIAPLVNGSRRFVFGASVQPSEFGKLAVVVWTAMLVLKKGEQMRRLTKGLLPFLIVVGILDVIAFFQPDLSVAMLYTLLMGIILFSADVRIGHFILLGILSAPLLWHEVAKRQYAMSRLLSFMGSGDAPETINFQLRQSLIAVGSGGFTGKGFSQGLQQYGWVPFGYNDFIGSNIGEEWGFLGMMTIVLAFALYTWLGFRIAKQARSRFLQLVAIGLTCTMSITAYLHIGVVIGLLPTTGLTLPFVSFGRSNLVLSFVLTGILVNIGSIRERVYGASATDPA
ncbi:MAG: FtsW/RodA/SpoVE family cell cycle protein [Gemmatimonadaceae bacterium]|nr:FtsW/RodA/SpoVE family cell cycle protein [Gemmatimonadaceae bacterium]